MRFAEVSFEGIGNLLNIRAGRFKLVLSPGSCTGGCTGVDSTGVCNSGCQNGGNCEYGGCGADYPKKMEDADVVQEAN